MPSDICPYLPQYNIDNIRNLHFSLFLDAEECHWYVNPTTEQLTNCWREWVLLWQKNSKVEEDVTYWKCKICALASWTNLRSTPAQYLPLPTFISESRQYMLPPISLIQKKMRFFSGREYISTDSSAGDVVPIWDKSRVPRQQYNFIAFTLAKNSRFISISDKSAETPKNAWPPYPPTILLQVCSSHRIVFESSLQLLRIDRKVGLIFIAIEYGAVVQ